MPGEQDNASENPYQPPRQAVTRGEGRPQPQSLAWLARPGAPSVLGALQILLPLALAVIVGVLLPIVQWLLS